MSKIKRRKPKHSDNQTSSKSAPDINMRSEPETQMPDLTNFTSQTLNTSQVLHLQRTIGNQATQRLLKSKGMAQIGRRTAIKNTMSSKAVQRLTVDDGAWDTAVDFKAGAGATGVVFFSDGANEVVVKGLAEAPQRSMFAQSLMEDVGGLTTAQTRIVLPGSPEGQLINAKIQALITSRQNNPNGGEVGPVYTFDRTDWDMAQRVGGRLQNANALMVMEKMNVTNFGELEKAEGRGIDLAAAFTNPTFWKKFGKLFAVDQFVGNSDRIQDIRLQNIFIDPMGELVALDNDTMFAGAIQDFQNGPGEKQISSEHWLKVATEGDWLYDNADPRSEIQHFSTASSELIAGQFWGIYSKVQPILERFVGELLDYYGKTGRESISQESVQALKAIRDYRMDEFTGYITEGVEEARNRLLEMMEQQPNEEKSEMQQRFELYNDEFKTDFGEDILFNDFGMKVRGDYLKLRTEGRSPEEAKTELRARYRNQLPRHGDFSDELKAYYKQIRELQVLEGENRLPNNYLGNLYDDINQQQDENGIKTAYQRGVDILTEYKFGQYTGIIIERVNRYLHKNLTQLSWEPATLIATLSNWIGQLEGKSERTSRLRGNRQANLQNTVTLFHLIRTNAQAADPLYQQAKNKN